MQKLSTQKIAQVIADTQKVLLSVTAERDKLAAENTELKRHAEAEKLASDMHEKGLRLDADRDELILDLEKAAEEGRIETIKEAVDMVAPNMGLTGTLSNDDVAPGSGSSVFESYILGSVG